MSRESYEREQKEDIEACLNCKKPAYLCLGLGKCNAGQRSKGRLEKEVRHLVLLGRKNYLIARDLGITTHVVRLTVRRLVQTGRLTQEQADQSYVRRRHE